MRIILLLMAVMLLMTGADARYSPGLEIAEGENITLHDGSVTNLSVSGGYIISHDTSTIKAHDPNGFLISEKDYTTLGGAGEVINEVILDINDRDIGSNIIIMPGNYYLGDINISNMPPWTTVSGTNYPFAGHAGELPSMSSSEIARFIVTNTTYVPFKLPYSGSGVEKISFFYPDQSNDSTPTAYAPAIRIGEPAGSAVSGESNVVRYVDLGNAYIGIELGETDGRAIIEHVVGYPLKYGIKQASAAIYDVCQISDVHFNPRYINGWGYYGGTLPAWVLANGEALYINRIDGPRVRDFFCFKYHKGINLTGIIQRGSFDACYLDMVDWGIYAVSSTVLDCDFTNLHIFANTYGIYMAWGILAESTFSNCEIESGREGIYLGNSWTGANSVFSSNIIQFHRDGTYRPGACRAAILVGDGWTFSDNHVIGLTSEESQGLLITGVSSVIGNNFRNLSASAVEVSGIKYIVANNMGKNTGGFPTAANTTEKFVGHNIAY